MHSLSAAHENWIRECGAVMRGSVVKYWMKREKTSIRKQESIQPRRHLQAVLFFWRMQSGLQEIHQPTRRPRSLQSIWTTPKGVIFNNRVPLWKIDIGSMLVAASY